MQPMPQIQEQRRARGERHGNLKQALIASAQTLLAEKRGWDFTLREVARHAGVSHNAPYNHFAHKLELLAEIGRMGFTQLTADMHAGAAAGRTPADALQRIGTAYVKFGLANPAHYRLMFGPALADADLPEDIRCKGSEAYGVLLTALEACERSGVLNGPLTPSHAVACWSCVHGLTMILIDGRTPANFQRPESTLSLVEEVNRLLACGILRPEAHSAG